MGKGLPLVSPGKSFFLCVNSFVLIRALLLILSTLYMSPNFTHPPHVRLEFFRDFYRAVGSLIIFKNGH